MVKRWRAKMGAGDVAGARARLPRQESAAELVSAVAPYQPEWRLAAGGLPERRTLGARHRGIRRC